MRLLERCAQKLSCQHSHSSKADSSLLLWYVDGFTKAKSRRDRIGFVREIGFKYLRPLEEVDKADLENGLLGEFREWSSVYYYLTLEGIYASLCNSDDELLGEVQAALRLIESNWTVKHDEMRDSEIWLFLVLVCLVGEEGEELTLEAENVWSWFLGTFLLEMKGLYGDLTDSVLQRIEKSSAKHKGWLDFCTNVALLTRLSVFKKVRGGPWILEDKIAAKEGLYELMRAGDFALSDMQKLDFFEIMDKLRMDAFLNGVVTSDESSLLLELKREFFP